MANECLKQWLWTIFFYILLLIQTTKPVPLDCKAIKKANPAATTGTYTIAPGGTSISATCEMSTNEGGWTYIGGLLLIMSILI
jgi:hypothetical protein